MYYDDDDADDADDDDDNNDDDDIILYRRLYSPDPALQHKLFYPHNLRLRFLLYCSIASTTYIHYLTKSDSIYYSVCLDHPKIYLACLILEELLQLHIIFQV